MGQAKLQIEVGMRFNRLTVVAKGQPSNAGHPRWECLCDCGKTSLPRQSHLIAGTVWSCGCYGREEKRQRQTKHGMFGTPEYGAWNAMKCRCYNPNDSNYHNYGGRGIQVCDRWLVGEGGIHPFNCFVADMGLRPSPELSIDRINNDGNYEPSNCRWASRETQSNNRRTNRRITYQGRTQTLVQWAREYGVTYDLLCGRMIDRPFESAILGIRKVSSAFLVEYQGRSQSLTQWCDELNLPYKITHQRLNREDWTVERAFETPIRKFARRTL